MYTKTADSKRTGIVSNFGPVMTWELFIDLVYEAESIKNHFLRIFQIRRRRHGFRLPFQRWRQQNDMLQASAFAVSLLPPSRRISAVGITPTESKEDEADQELAVIETKTAAASPEATANRVIEDYQETKGTRPEAKTGAGDRALNEAQKKAQNQALNILDQDIGQELEAGELTKMDISSYLDDIDSEEPWALSAEELEQQRIVARAAAKKERQDARKFRKAKILLSKRFPYADYHYLFRMENTLRGISRMHAEHLRATVHGQLSIGGASENEDPIEAAAQASAKIAEDKEIAALGEPKDTTGVDDIYALQTLEDKDTSCAPEDGDEDKLMSLPELDRLGAEVRLGPLATLHCCRQADLTLPIVMESAELPVPKSANCCVSMLRLVVCVCCAFLHSWCCLCLPCFGTGWFGAYCDSNKKSGAEGLKALEREAYLNKKAKALVKAKRDDYASSTRRLGKKSKYCV